MGTPPAVLAAHFARDGHTILAADTDPGSIASYVATQILNFEPGQPLQNVVDRQRGY
ncbi:hypothetical protein [Afipia sp. DC4300-2b1]|uniref:hypothetical protein n=1 Tax=Afipia sp. DC4300-2b1 TaxID=2804672 RepID=UPI003CF6E43F